MTSSSGNESNHRLAGPLAGCDTLVALAPATADGSVILAKNSDRPADESQPLFQAPRLKHPRGSSLKCQYLEIPQAEETCAVIGSRPHWLWGFEHGVNDCGVAIGNEAVFTKETLPEKGLLGMDLVRLGLERGQSAREALGVITGLLEQYGQGGAAHQDVSMMYDNSFLIADANEAYILETASRHYAWRKVASSASISNHVAIGDNWDGLSSRARECAESNGWWSREAGKKFDFAAAYRSVEYVPPHISEERLRQSGKMLAEYHRKMTPEIMMRILRDHYDSGTVFTPDRDPADGARYSICMHADPIGTTTASMVAHIRKTYPFITYWASLGNPCCGVFMPLYLQADIPPVLTQVGPECSEDSAWRLFKRLDDLVAVDYEARTPPVQKVWTEIERGFAAEADKREAEAAALHQEGKPKEATRLLGEFMRGNLQEVLSRLKTLMAANPGT
jgi:dipeptidase